MTLDNNQFDNILDRDYFSSSPIPNKPEKQEQEEITKAVIEEVVVEEAIVAETETDVEEADVEDIISDDKSEILVESENTELEDAEDEDFKEIFFESATPVSEVDDTDTEDDEVESTLDEDVRSELLAAQKSAEPSSVTMTLKGKIEAVLFLTNLPLSIPEVAEKLNTPMDEVELALLELVDDYVYREDSALEIDDTDGYILQIRKDYQPIIEKMLPVEISKAAVRTLSAIALKGPLLQSKLVEIRGSSAYEHIKELSRNGLIAKKRQQQSFVLKVTPKFHEYFKIQGSALSHILAQEEA